MGGGQRGVMSSPGEALEDPAGSNGGPAERGNWKESGRRQFSPTRGGKDHHSPSRAPLYQCC